MLTNKPWDKYGKRYNVSRVMDPGTLTFNQTKYDAYSPMYLGIANALRDMSFLMSNSALITYAILYFHREIISGFKAAFNFRTGRGKDIHNQLMAVYPEVPEWWYLIILIISIVSGCVMVEVYHTGMPIWGVFFAATVAVVMVVPTGIILGATNVTVYFNVLGEYVAGYAIPGKPLANMLFKAFTVVAPAQTLMFSSGLKLGHYSKIPPRDLFWVQTIGAVVGATVGVFVADWQVDNIVGLCSDKQKAHFTCPNIHTFFTGSLTWGLMGPSRMYGSNGMYSKLQWLVLAGFLLPVPIWYLQKKYPKNEFLKYVHIPIIISGFNTWVPYSLAYMIPVFYLTMIFNYWIKRKYESWWLRYNYLVAASFSIGLAISGLVIFFSVQYHDVTDALAWWGNTVPYAGLDFNKVSLLKMYVVSA
ncbi:Putative uncharacterized protein [Taphrina deformans PYCC 5710]|uniref:Oligopeptide transporter n=1 Tax=Taphrina deformans (strain PYCC 5710 / ATCC 11124 / CBS 356.35 / IMI 108563 / JCM 9778 / NBRC 8474) TaxID=1097556 RepID=R4XC22_TAPDE|nr:Putative uncharacterized protein [Taphrina deformans PYCC 5710]|eukprot:CCG83422.1 Putative uncharacterized protein [Taphrina deformans PYCC 5710]